MDELEPEKELEEELGVEDPDADIDELLIPGKKKPKAKDDDILSLDDLADEEDEAEDEDEDVDLW